MRDILLEYVYADIAHIIEDFADTEYIEHVKEWEWQILQSEDKQKAFWNIIFLPDNIRYVLHSPPMSLTIYAPFAISVEVSFPNFSSRCKGNFSINAELPENILEKINISQAIPFPWTLKKIPEHYHPFCSLHTVPQYDYLFPKYSRIKYKSIILEESV